MNYWFSMWMKKHSDVWLWKKYGFNKSYKANKLKTYDEKKKLCQDLGIIEENVTSIYDNLYLSLKMYTWI